MKRVYAALAAASILLLGVSAFGAKITAGNHGLLPDTPGQVIPIWVYADAGDHEIVSADLFVQLVDGGLSPLGGEVDGPEIKMVDLEHGNPKWGTTVFGLVDNTHNQVNPAIYPPGRAAQTITAAENSSTVADGLLAVITIDTTGLFLGDGPWDLIVDSNTALVDVTPPANPDDGPVNYIPLTIENGQIYLVPEPSTFLLAGLGVALLLAVARRRK